MNNSEPAIQDEHDVAKYLRQHPDFFHDHLDLLEVLQVPHPSGHAVSLIARQLDMFRAKHLELESQLTALIDIARENDTSFNRLHQLTLTLLEANDLEQVVSKLEFALSDYFGADFISLRIIAAGFESNRLSDLFIAPEHPGLQYFELIFARTEPQCIQPSMEQADFLFGENALDVKSCAIIPLVHPHIQALLAIGSREESRFHPSMGGLFLSRIGEIVSMRLVSLL